MTTALTTTVLKRLERLEVQQRARLVRTVGEPPTLLPLEPAALRAALTILLDTLPEGPVDEQALLRLTGRAATTPVAESEEVHDESEQPAATLSA